MHFIIFGALHSGQDELNRSDAIVAGHLVDVGLPQERFQRDESTRLLDRRRVVRSVVGDQGRIFRRHGRQMCQRNGGKRGHEFLSWPNGGEFQWKTVRGFSE